jgi:hypothetical protein
MGKHNEGVRQSRWAVARTLLNKEASVTGLNRLESACCACFGRERGLENCRRNLFLDETSIISSSSSLLFKQFVKMKQIFQGSFGVSHSIHI